MSRTEVHSIDSPRNHAGILDVIRHLSVPAQDALIDAFVAVDSIQSVRLACKGFRHFIDQNVREVKLTLRNDAGELPALPQVPRCSSVKISATAWRTRNAERLAALMTLCVRGWPDSIRGRITSLTVVDKTIGHHGAVAGLCGILYALPALQDLDLSVCALDLPTWQLELFLNALASLRGLISLRFPLLSLKVSQLLDVLPASLERLFCHDVTVSLRAGVIEAVELSSFDFCDECHYFADRVADLLGCSKMGLRLPRFRFRSGTFDDKTQASEDLPENLAVTSEALAALIQRSDLVDVGEFAQWMGSCSSGAFVQRVIDLLGCWPAYFTFLDDDGEVFCRLPTRSPWASGAPAPVRDTATGASERQEPRRQQFSDVSDEHDLLQAVLRRLDPVDRSPSPTASARQGTASGSLTGTAASRDGSGSSKISNSVAEHSSISSTSSTSSGRNRNGAQALLLRGGKAEEMLLAPKSEGSDSWLQSLWREALEVACSRTQEDTLEEELPEFEAACIPLPQLQGLLVCSHWPAALAALESILSGELPSGADASAAVESTGAVAVPSQLRAVRLPDDCRRNYPSDKSLVVDAIGGAVEQVLLEYWNEHGHEQSATAAAAGQAGADNVSLLTRLDLIMASVDLLGELIVQSRWLHY